MLINCLNRIKTGLNVLGNVLKLDINLILYLKKIQYEVMYSLAGKDIAKRPTNAKR